MQTFFKIIFIFTIFLPSKSYASKDLVRYNLQNNLRNIIKDSFYISIFLSYDVDSQSKLLALQFNPLFTQNKILRAFDLKFSFLDGEGILDSSYKRREIIIVYNIIRHELLTLYVNYGIYSMYNVTFHDVYEDEYKEIGEIGNSRSVGVDFKLYKILYLNLEKKWFSIDALNNSNQGDYYLGLEFKVPIIQR